MMNLTVESVHIKACSIFKSFLWRKTFTAHQVLFSAIQTFVWEMAG